MCLPEEWADKAVLCYVEGDWAYFTTQPLDQQWGDDWNDAPYEYNAGEPYEFHEHDAKLGREPWRIIMVAFQADVDKPAEGYHNSPFSVEMINAKAVPWLRRSRWNTKLPPLDIYAGTTLRDFVLAIYNLGGKVWTELPA